MSAISLLTTTCLDVLWSLQVLFVSRLFLHLQRQLANLCHYILRQLESKQFGLNMNNCSIVCWFDRPIVFGLSCENAFEADFVLATLVEDITPAQSQKQSQAVPSTQTNPHKPHTSTPASHIRRVPAPPNDSEAVFSDVLSGRQIVSQDISAIKPATQTCTEVEPMKVENGQSQETQSCKNSSVDVVGPSTEVRLKERRDVVQPLSPGSEDDSDNDYDFDFIPKTPPKKVTLHMHGATYYSLTHYTVAVQVCILWSWWGWCWSETTGLLVGVDNLF